MTEAELSTNPFFLSSGGPSGTTYTEAILGLSAGVELRRTSSRVWRGNMEGVERKFSKVVLARSRLRSAS